MKMSSNTYIAFGLILCCIALNMPSTDAENTRGGNCVALGKRCQINAPNQCCRGTCRGSQRGSFCTAGAPVRSGSGGNSGMQDRQYPGICSRVGYACVQGVDRGEGACCTTDCLCYSDGCKCRPTSFFG